MADLESLPDDGLQYELIDGTLLVSPAPVKLHQIACMRLVHLLVDACPPDLLVLPAPLDWQPDNRNSLQPDAMVVQNDRYEDKNITETPLLAIEVLSPSTRRTDILLKRSRYQESGVPSYWLVDLDGPSLLVLELRNGAYEVVDEAKGDESVDLEVPFPVTISPGALTRRNPRNR